MKIKNKLFDFFTPPMRFAGGFLCLAGVIPLFYQQYISVLLILIGLAMLSLHSAVLLDTENRKYKLYYRLFWLFKFGRYHTYSSISEISLKSKKMAFSTFSRSNRRIENRFTNYIITARLLPSNSEIPLFVCKNPALAEKTRKEYQSIVN